SGPPEVRRFAQVGAILLFLSNMLSSLVEVTDNLPERPEDFPIVTKIYMAPPDEQRKDAFLGALELRSGPNELESLLAAFVGEVAKNQARLYESWCHFGSTTLDRKSYLFRAKTSRKGELHFVMYSRMDFAFRHV